LHALIFSSLLEHGANLDMQDEDGYTALMYAVRDVNRDYVRTLLEKGAKRDLKNNHGDTAEDMARSYRPELLCLFKESPTPPKKGILARISGPFR
jgi:ankyrin repeat protein